MATVDEFRSYVNEMPRETQKAKLSQDALYDSAMLSSKLTESAGMGELDTVTKDISDESLEIIGTGSYADTGTFQGDYSKLPIHDRRKMEDALFTNDKDAVDARMIEMTAQRLTSEYDLTKAKEFITGLDKAKFKAANIKDRRFQQAMFATEDYSVAVRINDLHRNYDRVCREFNAMWYKHHELGKDKDKPVTGASDVSTDFRHVDMHNFSNESIKEVPKTDEERINYEAAKTKYLQLKYNYPLDYEAGIPTDEGTTEGTYPIIAGMLTAATAPVSGLALGTRGAYGLAGGVLDAPLTTGMNEMSEEIGQYSAPLGVLSSAAAVIILGPRAESALAKVIGATTKNVFIKPGNTLQKMLKFARWDDLKLSPDMYNDINSIITSQSSEFKRLLPNITNVTDDGMESAYKLPQTMYNDDAVAKVDVSYKDPERAQAELTHLEHNDAKYAVKEELDRREFVSYADQVTLALKEGDIDLALDSIGRHVDEAVDMSYRIIDDTQSIISNPKTNVFHHAYIGTMPEAMKQKGLYDPNALVHVSEAVANTMAQYPKYIKSRLGPFSKNTKQFNSIINRVDSGELKLEDALASTEVSAPVKESIAMYRKFNDKMYDVANKHYADKMNAEGVKQIGKSHVTVLRNTDGGVEVRDIRTEDVYTVSDPATLKPVTEAITKRDNFMHRHMMDNDFAVSVKKGDKPTKTIDTAKHGLAAHDLKREMIESGIAGKEDIIIHRIKDNPDRILNQNKNNVMVGVPKSRLEETINDSDALNQMLLDTGMASGAERVEFVDEMVDLLSTEYGIGNVKKSKYPSGIPSKHRTRIKALSQVSDPIDAMNAYSKTMARSLVESGYVEKAKAEFFDHYSEVLTDPKDFTSKLDMGKLSMPKYQHLNEKVIKLWQNQLVNMTRTPTKTAVSAQRRVDSLLYKAYNTNSKALHGLGRLLELQNKHFPFAHTAKFIGYSQSLAANILQAPLQATFLHFGLVKNGDMYLKNPLNIARLSKSTSAVSTALLQKQMGIPNMFKLSAFDAKIVKAIEDNGLVSNILGTEGGTSGGLLQGMHSLMMAPVAAGEFGNRIGNIVNTTLKAEAKGIELGTKEFNKYVSTEVFKDAQVLNQMTNSSLTTSPWTSWNVGAFKKFQLQWLSQFWQGTTYKQKASLMALGYAAYGINGIPGLSEPAYVTGKLNDARSSMMLNFQINAAASAENITVEQANQWIDNHYSDPKDRAYQKLRVENSVTGRDEIIAEVANQNVQTLLADRYSNDKPSDPWDVFIKGIQYKGYFDNALINIGYRSILEQADGFGKWSMAGPLAQSVDRAEFMKPMMHLSDAISKYTYGQVGLEDVKELAGAEVKKLWSALHPATSKQVDVKLQFEELIGAIDKNELYDEEGNQLGWADIWKDPDLQFDVEYKEQKPNQLSPKVLSETSSLKEIGIRLLGGRGGRIRELKKADQDMLKYYNKVLVPSINTMADLYDKYVADGKVEFANNLFYAFSTTQYHKWGGTPMYPKVILEMERAVEGFNARRTMSANPVSEMERNRMIKLKAETEELYNVR